MIAFDTNILTEILFGTPAFVERAIHIPIENQTVPIIVIEEIMRGRLNIIRQAEAGKTNLSLDRAYAFFQESISDARRLKILPYNAAADTIFRLWRQQGLRISTHDLRIAAICVAHGAKLVTRNRRDFEIIPDLNVEFWE